MNTDATRASNVQSTQGRGTEAERMLAALVGEGALELSGDALDLATELERLLQRKTSVSSRARALEEILLESTSVVELYWDAARLDLFLEDW